MIIKNNIPKIRKRAQKTGFIWLGIIALIFSELLIYTWVRTQYTHTLLDVSSAQAMLEEMKSHNTTLEVERNRLQSEDRIIGYAKNHLNLIGETFVKTIYLPKDIQ